MALRILSPTTFHRGFYRLVVRKRSGILVAASSSYLTGSGWLRRLVSVIPSHPGRCELFPDIFGTKHRKPPREHVRV